jgi:CO dehydrogenase nickel-insertion accessory protein CooC1
VSKQINLVINGKGGVGKSFFASNFVQYLRDCGIAHCAIDSEHENAFLKRFIALATPDVAKTLLPLSRDAAIARCLPFAAPPQAPPRPSFRQRVITAVCSESLTRLQLGA